MPRKEELYFSIDIETDGPIPGQNSMLSLGCAAIDISGKEHGSFSVNFETLPGATADQNTMAWWKNYPEAWNEARKNIVEPGQGIARFNKWVDGMCGKKYQPVAVAMPAGFDFMFVYWYLIKFTGYSPFSFSCVDMKTYVMAMYSRPYRKSSKRFWPKRWFNSQPHTHVAIDDAREQGHAFINMLKENEGLD